ncbi:Transmembrane protein 11, mitochondrial [Portunus trituberculatus]|uniref:Transmembrane protein 11, mitochondrial n=1 Tax=Portunus trituberculatus TaxID=210409 RepID=A0A5B7GIX0_PORTR|nr:Transmembrane protein 11, mitochondrial [Portunus trituberculatus]
MPLGTLSLFCTGVYTASWQFDPCCKYQVRLNMTQGIYLACPCNPCLRPPLSYW